jgi:hypothetical protein
MHGATLKMIDPVFNSIFCGSHGHIRLGVCNVNQSLLTHLPTNELLILSLSGIAESESSMLQQ